MTDVIVGRDIVFFLEDNPDVLDSTASFFETHGVPVLRAQTISEAWVVLEARHDSIRCAYIDKTLQRDQNAGMDFLIAARSRFPEIDFALLTGWNLDATERERTARQEVFVLEKTQARPNDLLARYYRGKTPGSDDIAEAGAKNAAEEAASSADILFSSRLQEDVLKRREERFAGRVQRLAQDLVQRMREDSRFGEGPILIGGSEYSTEELIHEICEGSELGLALVDAHFAELEEVAQRVYGGGE
jgi:hypothetical protein